ncbi:hypothetical protein GCM10010446_63910 [Streptomyces enissocaesilis]|uniref:Uncharacterized protein n=1 Tax=Streptomyces enissocaesilis TaxID=332589 RepID=A0ABN3XMQ6_9ACTN
MGFYGSKKAWTCQSWRMPQMMRMPGPDELPPGTRRAFVAELFFHYTEAGRPTLARVAAATRSMTDAFPVSRETIRRLLRGESVARWERVDAVLRALCEIANQDPDRRRWQESGDWNDDGDPTTCRQHLRQLLYDDIDEVQPELPPSPPAVPPPRSSGGWGGTSPTPTAGWGSTPSQPKQDDPWATTPPSSTPSTGGYSDEPPF